MVECQPSKLNVVGSNPIVRSFFSLKKRKTLTKKLLLLTCFFSALLFFQGYPSNALEEVPLYGQVEDFRLPLPDRPVIESDWRLEEKKGKTVSATELSTAEVKKQDEITLRAQEREKLEADKSAIRQKRTALLECMNEKDVTLFCYEGEELCKQQIEMFEEDFSKVKYVDCAKSKFDCPLRNISEYPTWYLGKYLGIKKAGLKELPRLARMTQCPW